VHILSCKIELKFLQPNPDALLLRDLYLNSQLISNTPEALAISNMLLQRTSLFSPFILPHSCFLYRASSSNGCCGLIFPRTPRQYEVEVTQHLHIAATVQPPLSLQNRHPVRNTLRDEFSIKFRSTPIVKASPKSAKLQPSLSLSLRKCNQEPRIPRSSKTTP